MRYRVLARSPQNAEAIIARLSNAVEQGANASDARRFVLEESLIARNGGIDAFNATCDWLEPAADEAGGRLIVIVDSVRPALLSAVGGPSWDSLLGMLILTFPDVRWVFSVCVGTDGLGSRLSLWQEVQKEHSYESLFYESQRNPLLDPTGLREWVRERTNEQLRALGNDLELPRRNGNRLAAAIEEEPAFAYFQAYTAYRFGCRADVIVTWNSMQSRFAGDGFRTSHGYWLILEDMSLNFADRDGNVHLLDLEERARECQLLDSTKAQEDSEHRVVVTTGQSRPGDTSLIRNGKYLTTKKCRGVGKIIYKPLGGMFDLWNKIDLLCTSPDTKRYGNVDGFIWPPPTPAGVVQSDGSRGHGAPGKLMLVAARLIARAKHLRAEVESTEDAVRGALLATDALECTGGRTPTTAADALALKHAFEVLAECQFSGVEYHLNVSSRLREIRTETAALARWFAPDRRAEATWNFEMTVLHALVGILRENLKFDEEQRCINRIRHLHNKLWKNQQPLRVFLYPFMWYIELLLSSFVMFSFVLLAWIIGLAFAYSYVNDYHSVWTGLADAITSFVAINPPMTHELSPKTTSWGSVRVACVAIVSGFVHLGVFIAHLYTFVSRR